MSSGNSTDNNEPTWLTSFRSPEPSNTSHPSETRRFMEREMQNVRRRRRRSSLLPLSEMVGFEEGTSASETTGRLEESYYNNPAPNTAFTCTSERERQLFHKKLGMTSRMGGQKTLVDALFCRECGRWSSSSGSSHFFRVVYRSIVPSGGATLDVKLPNIIIRRFTPDGKYLVCFSHNQKDLVVYRFVGPHFCTKAFSSSDTADSMPKSFEHFFSLHFQKTIALRSEILCKTFCIAGLNGSVLIVASWSLPVASFSGNEDEESNRRNSGATTTATSTNTAGEKPALNFVPCLEKLSLYSVDVETGRVLDSWSLRNDFVDLENHSGVHLLDDTLLVLSLRFQKLHVLKLLPSGMLVPFKEIGPHCFEDDPLVIAQAEEKERRFRLHMENSKWPFYQVKPQNFEALLENRGESNNNTGLGNGMASQGFYGGFMHRILTYFYAHSTSPSQFFHRFQEYTSLVILKAQLLDSEHIILRLARAEDAQRVVDPSLMTFFLGFYNMKTTRFVAILPNNHAELAKIVENSSHTFLHTCMSSPHLVAETSFLRYRFLLGNDATSWKEGNLSEHAVKRILSSIPCSCQVFHHSPYLDRKLFSFDESKLLALQGYKMIPCSDTGVIKFTLPLGGPLRFKLRSDFCPLLDSPENWKRLTSFLFHPFLPFVINLQQSLLEPLQVNFYYRL